jgi:chorismate synthase
MNSFGQLFRVSVFGESHGPMVGVMIDGCPPGLKLTEADFEADISRRKGGLVPGTTPRTETDLPQLLSGIFNDFTTGAPIVIGFENKNVNSKDYEQQLSIPRPGHADFVAAQKFDGYQDYRGGGHFSGRLTLCLVAAGAIAKKMLSQLSENKINISAAVTELDGQSDLEAAINNAIQIQDSIGGIVECQTTGIPVGWGEPFFDSLESMLSHAVFAIPAIKGIAFGSGFDAVTMKGSEHNDAIINEKGDTATNHAGGISGGISNGNPLVFKVAVKPASSTPQQQSSYNFNSKLVESFAISGRHDLCIALRVPVVIEAVTAIVLLDAALRSKMSKM